MNRSIIERRKEKIMAGTIFISRWKDWKTLCEEWDIDPYAYVDFGIDEGGGNSMDFEYIGGIPKKKDKEAQ